MMEWTSEQLNRVDKAEEVQIASAASDGALGKPVTVWAVRHGDGVYVRSVAGRSGRWFRATQVRREGRIRAGSVQQDITFVAAGHDIEGEIDAAYRAKYRRYTGSILNSVLIAKARASTLKLVPRSGARV